MRKLFLALALAAMTAAQAQIDGDDKNCFNHLSASVGAGTTGISLELGTVINSHLGLRAGVDFMPNFTVKQEYEFKRPNEFSAALKPLNEKYYHFPDGDIDIDARANPSMTNGKVLVDYFPSKNASFHLTAGLYFGASTMASMKATHQAIASYEAYQNDIKSGLLNPEDPPIRVDYEGYTLTPSKGRVQLDLNTSSVKPYLGLGFGRTVPRHRVGCKFELGVLLWGKPEVVDHYGNDGKGFAITKDYIDKETKKGLSDDFKDGLDIIKKFSVYPNLKISIVGRIF